MRKAIAFLTVFVMSISLFGQDNVSKYGIGGSPEIRLPNSLDQTSRTEDWTLYMVDSYGDGWNGASMDVAINGTLVLDDITVDASEAYFTITVDDGDIVVTTWTPGSWDGECAYGFYDTAGNLVASDGPNPTGISFTVSITPPAVFFSEYAEGSSSNKYLEIYNGTGAAISLDDYVILGNYNGNPWSETFTFAAGATLESGDVYVIVNADASEGILALADEALAYADPWYTAAFNGDDVRALASATDPENNILDIIGTLDGDGDGIPGEGSEDDPGGGFDVAGVSEATKDNTLRRKDEVAAGNGGDWAASAGTTADDSEYIVEERPTADYTPATLGWHVIDPNVTYSATFTIDMNGTGYPNDTYPSVVINGSWNGWAGWGVTLLDEDGDGIFTGSLGELVDGTMIEYVVAVTGESDGWSGWGVVFNAPLGSDCDYVPNDEYGNYGFTIAGADVDLAHIAGSCITCAANLASVHMNDSYGDGWNGNVLTIGTDALTIESGSYAFAELCLDDGSYSVTCDGGSYQGEVSWEILNAAGEVLLAGGAPFEGVLQLGETNDILGCMDESAINYDETATIDDGSCYYEGDSCSVAIAAVEGDAGNQATGAEQWFSYTATLDGTILATTCYEGQMEDTDLDVYDACDGNIIATSDDAFCGDVTGGNNYASEVEFACVTGETYYFFWDDTWGPGPNVWYFYEAPPPTGPTNLTAEAGLEMVSLEWEGVEPGSRSSNVQVATAQVGSNIQADTDAYNAKKAELVSPQEPHSYAEVFIEGNRNTRSTDVTIVCDGGSWQSEVSWTITDDAGNLVAQGGAPSSVSATLEDGFYTVEGFDAYGDGWNGNYLTVTGDADGTVYLDFTIDEGDYAVAYFTIGDDTPQAELSFTDMWYDDSEDALMVTVANTGDVPAGGFYVVYYLLNATDAECGNANYEAYSWITGLDAGGTVDAGVGPGILDFMGGYGTYEFGSMVDYLCAIDESDEDNNTITSTLTLTDPFDGVTWNVYRSDAGADFASLVTITSMDYLDEAVTGDVEYCYYVTQVDMEGADESSASNTACATPIAPVVLPVPTDLVADADEYNVMVNWVAPDLTGYDPIGGNPPVIGEKIDDVSTYIIYDPADYPLPNRQGGETVDDATEVDGLPYYNTGTTIGYTDDYDEACPYTDSTSPDVVYSFTPGADVIIDVSLCGEGTLYDTKVYVYENEAGALAGTLAGIDACNDDECANSTTNWLSYLPGVICMAGNTYYIVIDGYGGDAGDYELEILDGTPSPVMGYNVYRDGAVVGYNEGYSNTGWGEFMATEGTYEYYVTAMYEVFGESDASNSDTATVSAPAPTCAAPQNLVAETLGNDVTLMWEAPEGGPGWIGYYNGEFNGGVGTGAEAIFEVAAMFGPEQLSAYNGMLLTKVAFIPAEVAANYTVMLYDVSSGTPVAVDSSATFDGADLVIGEFHEVELANAITVDWTEALMFGVKCNTTTGYPGGIDTGPGVAGYGDLMLWGGEWISIVTDFGLDYNWAIEGFVDYGTGGRSLTSMVPINVDYPSSNGEVSAHTLATPVIVNTTSERTMTNYIVYRDDEEIATTEASDAMYYDEDVDFGTHTYFVTAMYDNSEDCGESDPSNVVEVDLMNNPPLGFSLISPGDGYEVFINEDNLDEQIAFIWTQASDPDNDPVEYTLYVESESNEHDTTTAQTGVFVNYGDIAEDLLGDGVTTATYYWDVAAHDPYDTTWSNDGARMFTVDISGLLGVDDDMLPDVFALHNNYPNPFNPVTNITYDIPEVAQVVLEIYNITGQKVRTLAQGQHEPGRYRIQWNATNDFGQALSSGMYIYRIQAGHFVSVKKLVLMK